MAKISLNGPTVFTVCETFYFFQSNNYFFSFYDISQRFEYLFDDLNFKKRNRTGRKSKISPIVNFMQNKLGSFYCMLL